MITHLITQHATSESFCHYAFCVNGKRVLGVIILIVAAIYGVSPVDLASEAVLGPLGLIDDGAVIVAAIGTAIKLFSKKKPLNPSE